jgi:hypothetical protein
MRPKTTGTIVLGLALGVLAFLPVYLLRSKKLDLGRFADYEDALVRGDAIVENRASRSHVDRDVVECIRTEQRLTPLGPLDDPRPFVERVQREHANLVAGLSRLDDQPTLESYLRTLNAQMMVAKYDAALEKVRTGKYVTLRNGDPNPPMPRDADWVRFGAVETRSDGPIDALVVLPKGLHPQLDALHKERALTYLAILEDVAGTFNQLPYEDRRARIERHDEAASRLGELRRRGASNTDPEVTMLTRALLDDRVEVDRAYWLLRVPERVRQPR